MDKLIKKNKNESAKEYPIIYTYIYEREVEDIKRLHDSIKKSEHLKEIKEAHVDATKVIIKLDFTGTSLVPIYKSDGGNIKKPAKKNIIAQSPPKAVKKQNSTSTPKLSKSSNKLTSRKKK